MGGPLAAGGPGQLPPLLLPNPALHAKQIKEDLEDVE